MKIDPQLSFRIRLLSLIAMIMVVFIHAYTLDSNGYAGALTTNKNYNTFIQDFISHGFTRVACPIFFAFSGLLLFLKFELSPPVILLNYKKRIHSLLIPFLLWSAFGIGLYYILQLSPALRPYFRNNLISEFTLGQLLYTLIWNPIPYQLWFLRDLMMLVLLSPVVWVLVRYFKTIFLGLALCVWMVDWDLVIFTSEALLFFSAGCLMAQNPKLLDAGLTATAYRFLLPIWFGLLILKTELGYLGYDNMTVLLLLHKTAILAGIVALWSATQAIVGKSSAFVNNRWINHHVSPFFIYAFHEPLLTMFKKAVMLVVPVRNALPALTVYFMTPVAVVIVAIVTGQVLKNSVPRLFAILTGNRERVEPTTVVNPETELKPILTRRV